MSSFHRSLQKDIIRHKSIEKKQEGIVREFTGVDISTTMANRDRKVLFQITLDIQFNLSPEGG